MAEVTVSTQVALSDTDVYMDKIFDMDPIVTSAYFGDTSRHITKREAVYRSLTKKFIVHRLSGAGVTRTLEADARAGSAPKIEEIEITQSYLRRIDHTLVRGVLAQSILSGGKHGIYVLATELGLEALESLDEKENQLLNSDYQATKGTIQGIYSTAGGTYTTADSAILTIADASIAMFTPGEVLDVRDATGSYAVLGEIAVTDVFHNSNAYGVDVSYPSIRVSVTNVDANMDDFDTVAVGDTLCHADDTYHLTTFPGFDASFSAMVDVTGATTYFGQTRTDPGKSYLMPYGKDYSSGGDNQPLDLDTIFDELSITMGLFINPTRTWLRNNDLKFTDAIVCQAPPALMPSIQRQAGEAGRRWHLIQPRTLPEAEQRKLIAVSGWNGAVVQTFGEQLPPIAFQVEPQMAPDTIRFFEPAVMSWLQLNSNSRQPQWLRNENGGRWHVKRNATTGNLQFSMDAVCFRTVAPFCSVPRLVYQASGLAAG